MEIINGARTTADFHPSVEPDVKANINSINALVRMLTPMTSTCFAFIASGSSEEASPAEFGMRGIHAIAIGIATMAFNQKIQLQLVNCTSSAPIIRPETLANAAVPPKIPIARACSAGCGKRCTMRFSAEGIVIAPAIPLNARSTIRVILEWTNPAPRENAPRPPRPIMNRCLGL